MNNRRIFIGLQHFAEGEGDGGTSANVPGNQTADNGGDAQDNAQQKPTFDDMLKDKDMQSEFDKRVSKALETAKTKWQKDADEKLSEAKKLEKMNAEQKAEYQRKQTEEKLAKREAEVTRRELMAEAKVQLADNGLPVGLAAVLDYTGADECKTSIETVSKAFAEEDTILDVIGRDELPARLVSVQTELAVIAYNRQGAEGETARSEGGISRSFVSDLPPDLQKRLQNYPRKVGVIRANDDG